MKVFLTGATGLLGSNVAKELIKNNHSVKGLVRNLDKAQKLLPSEIELIQGDLNEILNFASEMIGCDTLIHAGAIYGEFYATNDKENLYRTNVNSTLILFEKAYKNGIRNIIYIGSSAVLKTLPNQQTDEHNPYNSETNDPYFKSKIEAEKKVFEFLESHSDTRIIFILPSVMLGPADSAPSPTGKFMLNFLKGNLKFNLPGTMYIIDVRDVAKAVVNALENGASGERYIIGGNLYTVEKIINTLADVSGKPRLHKVIAPQKLLFFSYLTTILSRVTGKKPPIKPVVVKRLLENFSYSSYKAEGTLGLRFRPLPETLKDMTDWFQQNGMLDS